MKKLIQEILYKNGVIIRKKQPWMDNHIWLQELNINTVIDIGANEGQFAKEIRAILPSAFIYSFEPVKGVYEKMKENLAADKNKMLFNLGLGESDDVLEINVNDHSPSSSLLDLDKTHLENYAHATKTHKENITVKTLDGIMKENNITKNLLIKVDVQGYEDKVIAGGTDTFKMAKIAMIETTYKQLYKDQKLFEDIYAIMLNLGFKYRGNFGDLRYENKTGEVLFGDAIFTRE
jgi:FkbM family methyltransferase